MAPFRVSRICSLQQIIPTRETNESGYTYHNVPSHLEYHALSHLLHELFETTENGPRNIGDIPSVPCAMLARSRGLIPGYLLPIVNSCLVLAFRCIGILLLYEFHDWQNYTWCTCQKYQTGVFVVGIPQWDTSTYAHQLFEVGDKFGRLVFRFNRKPTELQSGTLEYTNDVSLG